MSAPILLARMIYNDGLNVMLAFGGVYAVGVFGWGEIESALYGIMLSVFAALGGLLGGRLADRIGTKRALQFSLSGVIIGALVLLGFAPDRIFFRHALRTGDRCGRSARVPHRAGAALHRHGDADRGLPRRHLRQQPGHDGAHRAASPHDRILRPLCAVRRGDRIPGARRHRHRDERDRQPAMGHGDDVRFLALGFIGLSFVREERAEAV